MRIGGVGAALLCSIVLSACGTVPFNVPGAEPQVTVTMTTTPEPDLPVLSAIVKTKAPSSLSGAAPAVVEYEAPQDIAVVATLECEQCKGTTRLLDAQRTTPLVEAKAPMRGQALVSILKFQRTGRLTVEADGPWTLTLSSWKDLQGVKSYAKAVGPRVFLLKGNTENRLKLVYKPADKSDSLELRTFPFPRTQSGMTQTIAGGVTELQLEQPSVVSIRTRGTWSLSVIPALSTP